MICKNCKDGADIIASKAISEMLHAKCSYPDCYCQHNFLDIKKEPL